MLRQWLMAGLAGLTGAQDTGGFYIGPPSINRYLILVECRIRIKISVIIYIRI
jgi:hypothetical protein